MATATLKSPWRIPTIWPGRTVYIVGGGPSIEGQDLNFLKEERTIGINMAFEFFPWVDVVYFGDCSFYTIDRAKALLNYSGLKITSCHRAKTKGWPNIKLVKKAQHKGIYSGRRDIISWNSNSGLSAINIAYWLGAKRIILIGFEMKRADGKKNYHNRYIEEGKEKKNCNPFHAYLRHIPNIVKDAKRLNIEILNATPDSAIKEFPIIDLKGKKWK